MEKPHEDAPLQEVIYKPTTQSNGPEALKPESSSTFFPYFAAAVASLMVFMVGIAFGWTSPVLLKLSGKGDPEDNPLGRPATPFEESWIAGCFSLGALIGPLAAGRMADKLGRKKSLLATALPMVVSFVATAFAKTVILYCVMRFLLGVGAGSSFTVLPMYLAEIAEDHNRGTIGCFMGVFITSGILFAYVVGPYVTIQNFCLVSIVPLLIFVVVFATAIPESPEFLAMVNDHNGLQASLLKFRKKSVTQVQKEAQDIMKSVEEEKGNKGGVRDLVRSRGSRKGLTVAIGLIILQQFAGINAVLSYMQTIFDATGGRLAPDVATIIVGVVQVVACIVTSSIVDRLGRRILLQLSLVGCCLSLISLGVYFHLQDRQFDVDSIFWLPVASLLVYVIAFGIGMGPLPWAMMAELFPANVRSSAASLTSFAFFGGAFVIFSGFPSMTRLLGMAPSFWSFAIICVGGMIFIYFVVPETNGKSLQEIQKILEGHKV